MYIMKQSKLVRHRFALEHSSLLLCILGCHVLALRALFTFKPPPLNCIGTITGTNFLSTLAPTTTTIDPSPKREPTNFHSHHRNATRKDDAPLTSQITHHHQQGHVRPITASPSESKHAATIAHTISPGKRHRLFTCTLLLPDDPVREARHRFPHWSPQQANARSPSGRVQ